MIGGQCFGTSMIGSQRLVSQSLVNQSLLYREHNVSNSLNDLYIAVEHAMSRPII